MGVSGIRGSGGKRRAGGAERTSASEPAQKSRRNSFSEKTKPVESTARARPSSAAASVDPLSRRAVELARKLGTGEIASKQEATKQFVADILEEQLRLHSRGLASTIAESLLDDPRLSKALDRLWSTKG